MIDYLQETDSRIVYPVPAEDSYSLPRQPANETFGVHPLPGDADLISWASEVTRSVPSVVVTEQAQTLLRLIQDIVSIFRLLPLTQIPQLGAFIAEDGSLLFEWAFEHYRIGFNVELNPEESGWYLITDRALGEISASGYTAGGDLSPLIRWLLHFVLSH